MNNMLSLMFFLFKDNWGFYEMGVVTNDVPMDIPENLIVLEPTENSKY